MWVLWNLRRLDGQSLQRGANSIFTLTICCQKHNTVYAISIRNPKGSASNAILYWSKCMRVTFWKYKNMLSSWKRPAHWTSIWCCSCNKNIIYTTKAGVNQQLWSQEIERTPFVCLWRCPSALFNTLRNLPRTGKSVIVYRLLFLLQYFYSSFCEYNCVKVDRRNDD